MVGRSFKLDASTVMLPRGTRVCLRTDVRGSDGFLHKTASVAVVREVSHHTYYLETPSGRELEAQRDQITLQREDLLGDLGIRQWDFRKLEQHVFFSTIVGSQAWGLASEASDEDVRGCFLAPFQELIGAIQADRVDSAEGAAEVLSALGLGTGHIAKKEIHAACRSLFDRGLTESAEFGALLRAVADGRGDSLRPKPHRPKNAYNLLRLLHSCLSWLRSGEPLIEVAGALKGRLLSIKQQEVPIEEVVAESADGFSVTKARVST